MIVVGLTGGIASGKTTIARYLKKKGFAVHDSDSVVRNLYNNKTKEFFNHLKLIGLKKAIKKNKISKKTIRNEVFKNRAKLQKLEKFVHKKVQLSRDSFLRKNRKKRKKMVILDIPLLFENKLNKICDYVFFAYSPPKLRIARALKRKNIAPHNLKKIINLQMSDKIKLKKSNFVINTEKEKSYSYKQTMKAINKIKRKK